MLLDRIDIDNHGPLTRVELGPFSEFLNVICTPEGSGKTAIARFIRDSLIRRDYPLGMMSSSAGRVVWADRNGKIHCRREHDGTASGRRTIEFESRGDTTHRFDWLHGSWIDGIADSTDASRALESIRIPETIVDGIVTDTAVTSVSRVIQACLSSGLGDPALFAGLPRNRSNVSGLSPDEPAEQEAARRAIRDELARIEAELAGHEQPVAGNGYVANASAAPLVRREQLRSRLAHLQSLQSRSYPGHFNSSASIELSQLHDRIWQLRVRHSELSRWLSHLRSDRTRIRYTAPITASPYASRADAPGTNGLIRAQASAMEVDGEMRRRLLEIDAQIIRWRRVMAELSSLREAILGKSNRSAVEQLYNRSGALPLTEQVLRQERMSHFLTSLDYYATHSSSGALGDAFVTASAQSWWPDEIDLRIEAIVRQIDWLSSHYERAHTSAPLWYRDLATSQAYSSNATLVRSLQAIRQDLQNVRRRGFQIGIRREQERAIPRGHELDELRRSEQWIVATIQQLLAHREGLVHDRQLAELVRYPSWMDEAYQRQPWSSWYIDHLDGEVVSRSKELGQVTVELEGCLARAAELRQQTRGLSGIDPIASSYADSYAAVDSLKNGVLDPIAIQSEIEAIIAELRFLDQPFVATVAETPRIVWLKNRRAELIEKMGVPQTNVCSMTPLADEASQWLVRLSGQRLRRVDWNPADFTTSPKQIAAANQHGFAKIDGREEAHCLAVDRALAALAVRMAAADLLGRTGRSVPLVVEAQRELLRCLPTNELTANQPDAVNLSVIAAIDDYAKNGRQVILLASDPIFADQAGRRGGQVFTIHGERVAREHRPLWQPHFAAETYAGPHAGSHLPPTAIDPMPQSDAYVDRYYDQYFDNLPVGASLADINRNLDTIWQEAYGVSPYGSMPTAAPFYTEPQTYESSVHAAVGYPAVAPAPLPMQSAPLPMQTTAPQSLPASPLGGNPLPGTNPALGQWHDGYYFADTYTTAAPTRATQATQSHSDVRTDLENGRGGRRQSSPFFLTVDSPIDQAPSIDAVAASRLRGLNVTHVNHLMNQDPNRLADSLGLAGVTAATIRRWQSECRLVCHVPQLRGFDARVLVGCGISDAGLLGSTDPSDLLDRVEAFLATERGQRILLSGTSYELSRITSWIAAANVNTDDAMFRAASNGRDYQTVDGRVIRPARDRKAFGRPLDNDQYEYEFIDDNGDVVRATSNRSRLRRDSAGRSAGKRSTVANSSQETQREGVSNRNNGSGNGRVHNTQAHNSQGHGNRRRPLRTPLERDTYGRADNDSQPRSGEYERGDSDSTSERTQGRSRLRSSHSVGSNQSVGSRSRRSGGNRSDRSTNGSGRRSSRSERRSRDSHSTSRRSGSDHDYDSIRQSQSSESGKIELRFYLERESPIVDAPSIGARMAEKLEVVGILTVDDLINADPAELAEQLEHRRIDAEVITAWQNQAILVCRVPMLRGHDAQLLVAAEVTTAEQVAQYDADELFALIDPIARSNEGKRIIRGGKLPDLEEITEWITYAALSRELIAA